MARPHTHACISCGEPVECPGSYEHNHDGWPEVICDVFDVEPNGRVVVCDDCRDTDNDGCKECGMVLGSCRRCSTCNEHRYYVGE